MSGNEENKEATHKALPLDLARTQITTVRAVEGKAPVLMTTQAIRGMRVLTQGTPPSSNQPSSNAPTIITTNIVPQAVFKSDSGRTQITSILTNTQQANQSTITIQRPITLTTTPVGTTYHVPRGPAVVANLAAPRSNVASVRAPMVVAAAAAAAAQGASQTHFVRPPRTPSPAQGTAWLTNSSNGNQIKGATTVLSSPVRGASVTGKPQVVRTPSVSTIRPGTLLHSAITIGQNNQIHTFKPGQGATGIQALGSAVTIAQILPSRTQAVVYSASGAQFTPNSRISVANTQTRQTTAVRPVAQVTTARLTVPVNVSQSGARLVTPQATVLTSTRISSVSSQQSTVTTNKIVTSQPLGRLSVAAAATNPQQQVTNLGQTRTLSFHPLVVANAQTRTIQSSQPNKIITQPTPQGTLHFTPLPTGLKTTATPSVVTAANRTINVPTSIMSQRQSSQAITVYSQDNQQHQQNSQTNVFIHTQLPSGPRRTSPMVKRPKTEQRTSEFMRRPTLVSQSTTPVTTTAVTTYSLAGGTYFYDAGNYPTSRPIGQQTSSVNFATISTSSQQQIRPSLNSQLHVGGQQQQTPPSIRINPVMVVDQQNRQSSDLETPPTKITSSPRPSILRKRDHDGSPLKAAKNLNPVLASLAQPQQQAQPAPISPPERPDSRGNGHSSGGSTTISATSSPGLAEVNDDSMPHVPMNVNNKDEDSKPPIEMSPRKKPRKQQLTGNDIDEHNDDMQFISESIKKENDDSDGNQSDEPRDGAPEARQVTTVRKPASASLLNSYRQTWKATHNHYLRYSDVRPKDERRPTIMDLANQYRVQEKVNGWKIYHLSTQMEDLADQEQTVYNQLNELLKCTESHEKDNFDKDVNRINELIKGNLQRIKIINDGMIEAKTQIMKIFDHKVHVTDIINRCASKRNFKKREKS